MEVSIFSPSDTLAERSKVCPMYSKRGVMGSSPLIDTGIIKERKKKLCKGYHNSSTLRYILSTRLIYRFLNRKESNYWLETKVILLLIIKK